MVRRRVGMTQAQFAETAGLTPEVVDDYETGRRQPTLGDVVGIIEAVGLELRLIVDERDRHDEVLAASLAAADPEGQARWVAGRDRWLERRNAEIAAEDERRRLSELIDDAEVHLGRPISPDLVAEAEAEWRSGC